MKEPTTTEGYVADLNKWGCEFYGEEGVQWFVKSKEGGVTVLESDAESQAVFEAWHLMKP